MASLDARQLISVAQYKFQEGNLPLAELLCRELLDSGFDHPAVFSVLGGIAAQVGMPEFAHRYVRQALDRDPVFDLALRERDALAKSEGMQIADELVLIPRNRKRYVLIKAWGYGFWSDVDHVLGQLLFAEMTGRIPVVYWGKNSLFGHSEKGNAFDHYFEPVSDCSVKELCDRSLTYFPPKWTSENLFEEDVNKWSGQYSRMAALYALNRPEDVVVSDFHTAVFNLLPWIKPGHALYGLDAESICQRMFTKYLRPKEYLLERVETFWANRLGGRNWLAVHVRGSDKLLEVENLVELNRQYQLLIQEMRRQDRDMAIFLLTDSEPILEDYKSRYGSTLVFTNSLRTAGQKGVHYSGHPGTRIGEEVAVDTYLAARCHRFLGNGLSNVSTTVQHMKHWQEGEYKLIGDNFLFKRNFFLHNR